MTMHRQFPLPELAQALLPHAFDVSDGAHDDAHLLRVWRNVQRIAAQEGGDLRILQAATLLHDCVNVDKGSPERPFASRKAADKAAALLEGLGWTAQDIVRACHAIEAHSYSAGIAPQSLEACILQDADRLDATGLIGVARCFYVAGLRRAAIHAPLDPEALHRPLDDSAFALDHFKTKLMRLGASMQTGAGRRMAQKRAADLDAFYRGLLDEIA